MEDLETPQFTIQWFYPPWRPDMRRTCHHHVVTLLECGLMFREDSQAVEEWLNAPSGVAAPYRRWLPPSRTEKIAAAVGVALCVATTPLTLPFASRGNCLRVCCYAGAACVPLALRLMVPAALTPLLQDMLHYTTLARRHITRCKGWVSSECGPLAGIQRHLCKALVEAGASLLTACPWLHAAQPQHSWEQSKEVGDVLKGDDLNKIHHLFLVLQSTFLKNVALAHMPPISYTPRNNRSTNQRLYWLHTVLLPSVSQHYQRCSMALDNAFRYFKEKTIMRDTKISLPRSVSSARDPWMYSEVHGSVTVVGADLRHALVKCNEIDSFLEACWSAKSKFSPAVLEEDLSKLRDSLLKCFASVEAASVNLKKIKTSEMKLLEAAVQKLPLPSVKEEEYDSLANVVRVSEDTPMNIVDQVFYFESVDKEPEASCPNVQDYSTGPGKKEIDMTKLVLGELKTVLIKREEEMRVREAKALENTMPELKGKVPDFPRQINLNQEAVEDFRIEKMYRNGSDIQDRNKSAVPSSDISMSARTSKTVSEINGESSNASDDSGKNNVEVDKNCIQPDMNMTNSKTGDDYESCRKDEQGDTWKESFVSNAMNTEHSKNTDNGSELVLYETICDSNNVKINNNANISAVPLRELESTQSKNVSIINADDSTSECKSNNLNSSNNGESVDFLKEEYYDDGFKDSDSDTEIKSGSLLLDVRKNRVVRRKNHPPSRNGSMKLKKNPPPDECSNCSSNVDSVDEGSKPVEYSFGTGLAMASLLQISQNGQGGKPTFPALGVEETFHGEGEVSDDSGNED